MTTLSKKQRKMRNRILIAAALLVLVKLLPLTGWVRGLCCLAPYFIIGYDVLRKAALGIVNGQVFDENFLMALATVGAMWTRSWWVRPVSGCSFMKDRPSRWDKTS